MKRKALLTLALLLFTSIASSSSYASSSSSSSFPSVTVLNDTEYLPATVKAINNAKSSIVVSMYLIQVDKGDSSDPACELVLALINAKKRGVDVRVVLENEKSGSNRKAIDLLTKAKVTVSIDDPYKFTHDKIVVIDGVISIVGSHNWTAGALTRNNETSLLVNSKETARELTEHIDEIRLTQSFYNLEGEGVTISSSFFTGPDSPGARLFENKAEQLFDLYLLLLKDSQRHPERSEGSTRVVNTQSDPSSRDAGLRMTTHEGSFVVDYERLGRSLGLSREALADKTTEYYRYYYRDLLRRYLAALDKTYGLIKYDSRSDTVEFRKLPRPADLIRLPDEYWTYGWDKKFSFGEKYFYLIALREGGKTRSFPWWKMSNKEIEKIYGMAEKSITDATVALRRHDVLEAYRVAANHNEPFWAKPANQYLLKELYPADHVSKGMERMSKRYGRTIALQARELCGAIDEPNDLGEIETMAGLIQRYGYEKVKAANAKTAALAGNNGKRHVGYTISVLLGGSGERDAGDGD